MDKLFFIIAGEASGDLLGSKLITEIREIQPQAKFIGIGGELMKKAGLEAIFDINELSVMGFFEVLPHIPNLLRRISLTAQKIAELQPDFLITIDAPDFCFRVVNRLKSKFNPIFFKTKKIHLIAPSVWAYRASRAKKIAKIYDLLLAILPFEPPYFEKYGLKTVFIGHPLFDKIPEFSQKQQIRAEFCKNNQISENDILVAITPGSRNSEIDRIFPEFIAAINKLLEEFKNLKPLVLIVEKTQKKVREMAKNLAISPIFIDNEKKSSALLSADFGIAKSGTNSIEMSLSRLPIIIGYKINVFSHFLLKLLIKIRFANLVNLVADREIIPELLQNQCRSDLIAAKITEFIKNPKIAQKQVQDCLEAMKIMGLEQKERPMKIAAKKIISEL